MILMAYDGSADAQAAIDRVAQLMPGAETLVLTVWEPYMHMLSRTGALGMGLGAAGTYADAERIDADCHEAALGSAVEGVLRANAAGLVAQPQAQSLDGGIAHTILAAADDANADIVVVGTRGLGGVKSFLLGSVSHAIVQHADRPVLVVPSAALARRRREHADQDAVPA